MQNKILIIAQNQELAQEIWESMRGISLDIHTASSFLQAIDLISRFTYVMVIMDFDFSEQDGVEVVRRLRRLGQMPILVLSAHATSSEEVQALNAGADHYLAIGKPLDTERCLANAMAIMRRHLSKNTHERAAILISGSGLKINLNMRKAYLNGEDLHLTPKQFALLSILSEHMGEVVTKEDLYQEIWENNFDIGSDAALKYHIKELRKKLNLHGADSLIETIWGVGYVLSFDRNANE